MKVIIYGSDICGDCLDTKAYLKEHADDSIQYNYFDITKSTANLKRFLKLRDTMDLLKKSGTDIRSGFLSFSSKMEPTHWILKKLIRKWRSDFLSLRL